MATVDILMASYNGEKYIAEQIGSILGQTFTDWRLVIRDDGSSDNTPAIIEGYAAKYPGKIEIVHDDAVCKSATKNFFELLKHAEADYVMFCDQDDVWLKYKVQITLDYMKDTERDNPGKPVCIFTGLQVVDAELRSMDCLMSLQKVKEKFYTFRELLAVNYAAGCTQMINRKVYENIGGFEEGITLHDWWTMLYASAFGVVVRVPMALILYRQHENNAIGIMPKGVSLPKRIFHYMCHPFAMASLSNSARRTTLEVFSRRFSELMSSEKRNELNEYLKLFSRSMFKRYKAIRKFRDLNLYNNHKLILLRFLLLGDK